MFCSSIDSKTSLNVDNIQNTMRIVRWCPLIIFSCTFIGLVFLEHTKIVNIGNRRVVQDNSEKSSFYPYDSNEITRSLNCFWPILTEDDLSLLDHSELTATIDCEPRYRQLFALQESGIIIPQVTNNNFSGVRCTYRSFDNRSSNDQPLSTEGPTFLVREKRISVKCVRNESIIYSNEFFNFASQPKLSKSQQREPNDLNLSLSIIALDSVSLTEFHRLMPLSYRYMKYLGFVDSEMFNKKNHHQTVVDIITGGEKPVWEVMRDRGCISYISGLTKDGTDHSKVDFFSNDTSVFDGLCTTEGKPIAFERLEELERFHLHYTRQCTFSLQIIRGFREMRSDGNGSQRWFNKLAAMDAKLRSTLERLVANNIFANTAIVVMGDLGNKHNTDSLAGRVEQSTPLLSIRMPHGFRAKRPKETATLYRNRKRLTSNDDIAETLNHIARGFEMKSVVVKEFDAKGREKSRTAPTSLFVEQYDDWRRCGWLGIDDSACQCQSKRMGRTKKIGRDSREYRAVRSLMEAELLQLPCIRELADSRKSLMQVLEPGLLPSLKTSENIKVFDEGVTARGDVEYFRLDQDIIVREQPFRQLWTIKVRGHVRHDVRRDKYDLLGEIVIISNTLQECTTQRISDFCQLCTVHGSNLPLRKEESEYEGDQGLISAVTHA